MKNPRITPKERNLLKGAARRVFSRSDLRKSVLDSAKVAHSDPKRPRVKTWYQCKECGHFDNANNVAVDHVIPIVDLKSSLEEMSWDELINRIWCEEKNLQVLCDSCHNIKTKAENKLRRQYKKERQK